MTPCAIPSEFLERNEKIGGITFQHTARISSIWRTSVALTWEEANHISNDVKESNLLRIVFLNWDCLKNQTVILRYQRPTISTNVWCKITVLNRRQMPEYINWIMSSIALRANNYVGLTTLLPTLQSRYSRQVSLTLRGREVYIRYNRKLQKSEN